MHVAGDRPGDRACASRSAFASIAKSRLLSEDARRAGVRLALGRWSGRPRPGIVVGAVVRYLAARRRGELIVGIPAILVAFGAVLWTKGFGPEDRELFRLKQGGGRASCARPRRRAQARDHDRRTISLQALLSAGSGACR